MKQWNCVIQKDETVSVCRILRAIESDGYVPVDE